MACGDQDHSGCSCTHNVQPSYHPQLDPCVYLEAIVQQLDRLNTNLEKLQRTNHYQDKVNLPIEVTPSAEFREMLSRLTKK